MYQRREVLVAWVGRELRKFRNWKRDLDARCRQINEHSDACAVMYVVLAHQAFNLDVIFGSVAFRKYHVTRKKTFVTLVSRAYRCVTQIFVHDCKAVT